MRSQRWTSVGFAGRLFSAVLVCSTLIITTWVWFQPHSTAGQTEATNRIAYIGSDGNVYTVKVDGTDTQALTTDALISRTGTGVTYLYPTWSPGSRHLAFVGTRTQGGRTVQANLYVAPVDGGNRITAFASQQSFPFYLYWAPDNQQIAFLTQETSGLFLRLGYRDPERQHRILEQGNPFYLSWSPDSQKLLFHIGGAARFSSQARLSVLEVADEGQLVTLPDLPALFQAPAWSPGGDRTLFAAQQGAGSDILVVADVQGQAQQRLLNFEGIIAFGWSPSGNQVAYIVAADPTLGLIGLLSRIRADGTDRRRLADEPVMAFFWSPDARKIAYLVPSLGPSQPEPEPFVPAAMGTATAQQGELLLTWHVVELEGEFSRSLVTFRPSNDFLLYLSFFDQYAQSLTFWSPSSRYLIYSGRGEDGREGIWVIDTTQDKPTPQFLVEGTMATWSWR
ncbi:MAG: TolB family protein [Candidatus Bipolaricaulia bacterium]